MKSYPISVFHPRQRTQSSILAYLTFFFAASISAWLLEVVIF